MTKACTQPNRFSTPTKLPGVEHNREDAILAPQSVTPPPPPPQEFAGSGNISRRAARWRPTLSGRSAALLILIAALALFLTPGPTAQAQSSDAYLKSLGISHGTLHRAFAPTVRLYRVTVANNVSSITVTPTANDPKASITVGGATVASGNASPPQNLIVGINTITITVTSEDGATTKNYYVDVTRPAPTHLVRMGADDDYEPDWGGITGAAVAGDDGVTLNWRAPTNGGNVKGYRILRREAGFTAYVEIHDTLGDTDPTATGYVDPLSSAESGKDYMYRVKVVNTDCQVGPDWYAGDDGRGWPDPKNFGRATVQTHSTAQSDPAAPTAAPAAPQMGDGSDSAGSNNGKANGATAGSSGITVTWMAPTTTGSAGVKGYVILRREAGNRQDSETARSRHLAGSEHKYREIHTTPGDTPPTELSYLDPASGLAGGTTYLYRVRAINNNCYISPDPTRHDQTGYSFGDNNFGKATAQ